MSTCIRNWKGQLLLLVYVIFNYILVQESILFRNRFTDNRSAIVESAKPTYTSFNNNEKVDGFESHMDYQNIWQYLFRNIQRWTIWIQTEIKRQSPLQTKDYYFALMCLLELFYPYWKVA